MIRPAFASVLALVAVACSVPNETERAAKVDFAMGDECFYTVARRPDDCASHPPCMWSDANLRIARSGETYRLYASSGAWDGGPPPSHPLNFDATASSPVALARQLPRVIRRF